MKYLKDDDLIQKLLQKINDTFGVNLDNTEITSYLRKTLTASDSIGNSNRRGHGVHIEITDANGSMLLFPVVTSSKYLQTRDTIEKRRFYAKINIQIPAKNFKFLLNRAINEQSGVFSEEKKFYENILYQINENYISTYTHVTFNKRKTGQLQLEISYLAKDDLLFTAFRKTLLDGDEIIFLKKNNNYYYVLGIPNGKINFNDIDKFYVSEFNEGFEASSQEEGTFYSDKEIIRIPKPFILLAGLSGTGKTRFVKKQAEKTEKIFGLCENDNYCLIPVRPDWHEPSDLLGYISRLNGTKYIPTDFLRFLIKAISEATEDVIDNTIQWKNPDNVAPFWLCLDEMNLAPVEQYFSDYLSVLETREWNNGKYTSGFILQPSIFRLLEREKALDPLWDELFDVTPNNLKQGLCDSFKQYGVPLPPNLIVAGTFNMDETTHNFSRKVIDRALTIDFQEFFKNDFDTFFENQLEPKILSFPVISQIKKSNLPEIDSHEDSSKSLEFFKDLNDILLNSPFELAYRSLNELLLSVCCFAPYDEDNGQKRLQAVWDDYLMQKVLPRIEGDIQKLKFISDKETVGIHSTYLDNFEDIYGKGSLLHRLYAYLEKFGLSDIWGQNDDLLQRPDLLQLNNKLIKCRSRNKLLWMMKRLKSTQFTDFWV